MEGNNEGLNESYQELEDYDFVDIIKPDNINKYKGYYKYTDGFHQLVIEEKVIKGDPELLSNEKLSNQLFVKDCVFIGGLKVSDGEYTYIKFERVKFNWPFRITGGKFNGSVHFKDCIFVDPFSIDSANFRNDIRIEDCVFNNDFTIYSGSLESYIRVEDCTFKRNLVIEGGTFNGDFASRGNIIDGYFLIYGGTFNNVFEISKNVINGDFTIVDGNFNHYVLSSGCEYKREFLFEGGKFAKSLTLNSGQFNQIRIHQIENPINLIIKDECQVLTLKFETILHKDTFIQMFGGLSSIIFEQVTNLGTIQFINTFCYSQANIQAWVKKTEKDQNDFIYHSYVNRNFSLISIINSDLGKLSFIGCNLTGFALNFKSSKITETFITGSAMPKIITSDSNEQKQLGYSQIKKIYEARGDKVTANQYLAKEMNAYYSSLRWCKNFGEKLNVFSNKISTNHGQSWLLGLLTTFFVGVFFFSAYCWQLGIRPIWPIKNGVYDTSAIDCFKEVSSYFLEFINPIHKADYIAEKLYSIEKHISGSARTIEGVSRIFIAYFAYQLIQAFRKHGKPS